jgi:hypothetical protein
VEQQQVQGNALGRYPKTNPPATKAGQDRRLATPR